MELVKAVTGVYVLEDGELVDSVDFSEEELPEVLQEESELEQEYRGSGRTVLSTDELSEISGSSVGEIRSLQREAAQELTRQGLEEEGGRDQLLVQAVRALEDLDEINNELSERLRPWYALHFPEMEEEIDDNAEFAAIVEEGAERDAVEGYAELAEDSTGMELTGRDAEVLEEFADHVDDGYELRGEAEAYVEQLAGEVAPNLSEVLGPVLAARVVSLAGSLEKLAKMPSSTVQVLGAEKAMFRHMKGEGDAPKHGVLFMHEYVRKVPYEYQGKMARVLANKASIAARIDNYGGEFKAEELAKEVRETYEEVKG